MKKVLVIGAGPAGLAAGVRLLERGKGELEVKLIHMGHHLGGKAASYRMLDGRFVEHGWHMVVGFYDRMRGLMKRAGIGEVLRSMGRSSHPYEPATGEIHSLDSGTNKLAFAARFALVYDGIPARDKLNYSRFFAQAFAEAGAGGDLTRHDDVCFNTWAVERGLRPHLTKYSQFRFLREAYFNFPEQISAYHVLQSLKLMSDAERGELFVLDGPYSEKVWEPIAQYFANLGGDREPYLMATDFVYQGRAVTGVKVVKPDGSGHHDGTTSWTTATLPREAGSERVLEGYDYVISTVPHAVFSTMNADDARWWGSSYFSRLKNLRSAATVSMVIETHQPVLPFEGPVFGFPAPLGIAVNMTPYWDEVRKRGVGSVIAFVGQEAGFESWSDEQIIEFTLDNFSRQPQVGDLRAAGIKYQELHRNKSDFERLLLCEPGVNSFRPGPKTPFHNLFLAGDWVRNDVDLICMEGAICSGEQAADLVLESAGVSLGR